MSNTFKIPDELDDWMNEHFLHSKTNSSAKLLKALPKQFKEDENIISHIDEIYNIYNDKREALKPKKKKDLVVEDKKIDENILLDFPFRSKLSAYLAKTENVDMEFPEFVNDKQLTRLARKFKKPNYSPVRNSWEMDIMFANFGKIHKLYLVLLNINTRYAIVEPIKNKSAAEVSRVIKETRDKDGRNIPIDHLKGDGEAAFAGTDIFLLFDAKQNTRFDASPYTFHNKSVDSFIRTLRNAAGLDEQILTNNKLVQQLVEFYNNTPHNGLPKDKDGIHYTPYEAQNNPDIEWQFIRAMDRKLRDVQMKLHEYGYDDYKKGNILIMHVPKEKTSLRFKKKRRNFDELGMFIKYDKGSVMVKWLSNHKQKAPIRLPIFYTKKIANSMEKIPDKYKKFFNLK